MLNNGYAQLLQQLRFAETRKNMDLTDRAMEAYRLRIQTIENSDESPERKERQIAAAQRQWAAYMQRPMPEAWPPEVEPDPGQ